MRQQLERMKEDLLIPLKENIILTQYKNIEEIERRKGEIFKLLEEVEKEVKSAFSLTQEHLRERELGQLGNWYFEELGNLSEETTDPTILEALQKIDDFIYYDTRSDVIQTDSIYLDLNWFYCERLCEEEIEKIDRFLKRQGMKKTLYSIRSVDNKPLQHRLSVMEKSFFLNEYIQHMKENTPFSKEFKARAILIPQGEQSEEDSGWSNHYEAFLKMRTEAEIEEKLVSKKEYLVIGYNQEIKERADYIFRCQNV